MARMYRNGGKLVLVVFIFSLSSTGRESGRSYTAPTDHRQSPDPLPSPTDANPKDQTGTLLLVGLEGSLSERDKGDEGLGGKGGGSGWGRGEKALRSEKLREGKALVSCDTSSSSVYCVRGERTYYNMLNTYCWISKLLCWKTAI